MSEILVSIPCLLIAVFVLYRLNPKYCFRCDKGTNFVQYQNLQHNPKWPIQQYCLKCFFYINLSKWECSKCQASGTTRLHDIPFYERFLIIKNFKNVYRNCKCGNRVEIEKVHQ